MNENFTYIHKLFNPNKLDEFIIMNFIFLF